MIKLIETIVKKIEFFPCQAIKILRTNCLIVVWFDVCQTNLRAKTHKKKSFVLFHAVAAVLTVVSPNVKRRLKLYEMSCIRLMTDVYVCMYWLLCRDLFIVCTAHERIQKLKRSFKLIQFNSILWDGADSLYFIFKMKKFFFWMKMRPETKVNSWH